MTEVQRHPIAGEIIDCAIRVHRQLGPGLLESTYQVCLDYELRKRGLCVAREVVLPVVYDNIRMDCGYRLDLLVNDRFIVEVKSVAELKPIHTAQVLTYLRLSGAHQALLFNFNCVTLKAGMRSYLGQGKYVPKDRESERSNG